MKLKPYNNSMLSESDLRFLSIQANTLLSIKLMGLMGNTAMFGIYFAPALRKLPLSMYFRAMALCCLVENLKWLAAYSHDGSFIDDNSPLACKLLGYLSTLLNPISAWLDVAACVDRFVTIVFPKRFTFLTKTRVQVIVILGIVLYNMGFYFHLVFDFNLVLESINHTSEFYIKCETNTGNPFKYTDFVNSIVLPFSLMILTSIAMIFNVVRSHSRVSSWKATTTNRGGFIDRTRKRDIKFGVTMICFTALFFVMNAPVRFLSLLDYMNFDVYDEELTLSNAGFVATILFDAYYCVNFYVQIGVNSLVRREFVRLASRVLSSVSKKLLQFKFYLLTKNR